MEDATIALKFLGRAFVRSTERAGADAGWPVPLHVPRAWPERPALLL